MHEENFYGNGPGLIRRKRDYAVKAVCSVDMTFFARDAGEAEDLFNDFSETVQGHYPDIALEIKSVREDDWGRCF